jgi:hypothetical protein
MVWAWNMGTLITVGIAMEKRETMGLMQRFKSWLRPSTASELATAGSAIAGPAVAGYVRRAHAEVEIMSSNIPRPLAVLMPAAVAAATPMRTIPLFVVPSAASVEADVEIVENDFPHFEPVLLARQATKLHLVYNADTAVPELQLATTTSNAAPFLLAARLASVAHLNTVAGKVPAKPLTRVSAQAAAKTRAKLTNRPLERLAIKPPAPKVVAASSRAPAAARSSHCFVRPQANGKSSVTAVPQRAKRRAA